MSNSRASLCCRPAAGYDWNPLTKYERNAPCFCLSGKKAKKCCLPMIPRIIPQDLAAEMKNKTIGVQHRILVDFYREQQQQKIEADAKEESEVRE